MSYTLNLSAIKNGFQKKTTDELIEILKFSQDNYNPDVLPLIEEVLISRGVKTEDLIDYKSSYNTLISKLNSQPTKYRQAGFMIRAMQYIIDHFLFVGICYLIQYYLLRQGQLTSPIYESYCLLAYFLYYALTIGCLEKTIGMMIMGLKVLEADNSKINIGHGIWRSMCMILNYFTLQLGHLWMLTDGKNRTAVDIWSKTKVVYSK